MLKRKEASVDLIGNWPKKAFYTLKLLGKDHFSTDLVALGSLKVSARIISLAFLQPFSK